MEQSIQELRKSVISLGKEVAESHSTTQFPEWVLLKVGIQKIQGLPYEKDYFVGLLETNLTDEQSD